MADELDLTPIKTRCVEASEGPWAIDPDLRHGGADQILSPKWGQGGPLTVCFMATTDADEDGDAQFVANARTDVPALIDEVERLRRELFTVKFMACGILDCEVETLVCKLQTLVDRCGEPTIAPKTPESPNG